MKGWVEVDNIEVNQAVLDKLFNGVPWIGGYHGHQYSENDSYVAIGFVVNDLGELKDKTIAVYDIYQQCNNAEFYCYLEGSEEQLYQYTPPNSELSGAAIYPPINEEYPIR